MDVQYVSTMFALQNWVESDKFAARPAAQASLRSFAKEEPNGPLKLFGFGPHEDVTVVGAVLCDVFQWGEPTAPTEDCDELAERLFSYHGARWSSSTLCFLRLLCLQQPLLFPAL